MEKLKIIFMTIFTCFILKCEANKPPVFTQDMKNVVLSEATPVGTKVYKLEGYDPEGSDITFGLIGTDHFEVNPKTGDVTLVEPLDREEQDTLSFFVTIKDRVNGNVDSQNDNLVEVLTTVIVSDENDNVPEFQNIPYEAEVLEDAKIGTTIFNEILVTDKDTVGEILDLSCIPQVDNPEACLNFEILIMEANQDILKASVILNSTLNYNHRMIYHFKLAATDGTHTSMTNFEVRVKDVQNSPPIFHGSLSAVIDENSPIGTLVLKVQARDGDSGEPRKIVYDLLTNPMDYFLLDSVTGELKTAKPLDKEALSDTTGLITLIVRARELVNGVPGSDNLTSSTTQATITVRDVNDSPPTFNKKEYEVSILENTPPGTPLALDMNVTDRDVGQNSVFSLHLEDVSGVFEIEPTHVRGFSQVNIRVGNGTLDYENPNQRKFIVLVVAEETETDPKLSSTATITVSVIDANDNKPIFDQESYSASISEASLPGQYITTIIAKDADSGVYGDQGIRYSISGTGAELFKVNPVTGVITLANCHEKRTKRQIDVDDMNYDFNEMDRNVNVTTDGQSGIITIDHKPGSEIQYTIVSQNENNDISKEMESLDTTRSMNGNVVPEETCLDYETRTAYFLSYKATDDEGRGQSSVVSLRISVLDANDSPPVCENPYLTRASIDEGAKFFDPPLIVKARDLDTISDITYKIIGDDLLHSLFEIDKRSGQINIKSNATLDVNHLKSDHVVFHVEANDGIFTTQCKINITIRDVNNHAPKFLLERYEASIGEDSEKGTEVMQLNATDLDSGINAEIRYRIQQGSFDDFRIDNRSGIVTVARKLDYDRRNTYQIEILASDMGTPSLSGTTTLEIFITNSNDKDPYFTPMIQRAKVREDAPVGTVVHTLIALDPDVASVDALEFTATEPVIAVDKDGKEVEHYNDFREYFLINRNGTVTLNKKLDRDLFAVLRLTVLVTDSTAPNIQQGQGMLIISIIDVNEIPPKFLHPWTPENPIIKLQMMEEQPIGSYLTTLQATDEDSTIGEYNINENPYFEINSTTGVITTKSRIDYESIKEIFFTATVTDTGIPQLTSTAEVVVNVINLNDNEPRFNENIYHFNVLENSPRGTVVGKVEAKDDDLGTFGEVTYSLIGEYSKNFIIDSDTGIILVANSSFLDRERLSEVTLSVKAEDKAPITTQKSTTATIFIKVLDINDNPPVFLQGEYSSTVAENAALMPPAALLQVKAEDRDEGISGEIRYIILSGNEENLFQLDPVTGIIYPGKSLLGKNGIHTLNVEARDGAGVGPFKSTTLVKIEVISVNQHRPTFVMPTSNNATVELPGDEIPQDFLIMTIKASDNDTGDNGKISYHLQINNNNVQETEEFKIDEITGELRTRKPLRRSTKSIYDLVLVARDHGSPTWFESLRFLTIVIVDINENRPEFPESVNPYRISIQENNGRDIKIGRVVATTGRKNPKDIYYYMLLGNEEGAFYLDKTTGDIFTNKSLDRETIDSYNLYILASSKPDLHISDNERASFSIKSLDRDNTVAKVWITILDVNDNEPIFDQKVYYAGVNTKTAINEFVTLVNATDKDQGRNASIDYIIIASNLFKFGSTKSTGSIVPSPFSISKEGRITTASFMAEYNQDRFELEVIAKEVEPPERFAKAKVYIWVYETSQLIRVILSRSSTEVHTEQNEIISELQNATQSRIIVDDIRYHVDSAGRIRMDWCDLFFHAVNPVTHQIISVDDILKVIDANYDYLKDYYAGFAIENVLPAYVNNVQEEFDLALAGLVALVIVLFVGVTSFVVLCCCLKHWNLTLPPVEGIRKEGLIKKQIIDDLNTTENPLWIEQKLKLYEEQELTMQVFSEPEQLSNVDASPVSLERRDSFENSHAGDSTYATIQLRNGGNQAGSEFADYATLRNNNRTASMYEFTGSTFQAPIREQDDVVTELI